MITSSFLMSLFDLLFGSIGRYDWQKCMGRKKSMMNKKCFDIVLICCYDNLILNIIRDDTINMITHKCTMIWDSGSISPTLIYGEMAERSIASDCKSDASRLQRFKSFSPQSKLINRLHGPLAHLARAPALHAGGEGFDSPRVHH